MHVYCTLHDRQDLNLRTIERAHKHSSWQEIAVCDDFKQFTQTLLLQVGLVTSIPLSYLDNPLIASEGQF